MVKNIKKFSQNFFHPKPNMAMAGLGPQGGGRRQLQHGCSAVAKTELSEWREEEGERRVNRGLTQLALNFCVET